MKEILSKCKHEDLEYLSQVLDSNLSFTDDRKRKGLLAASKNNEESRQALIDLIDKQIRYYGSSDFAYRGRHILNKKAGVSDVVLINDVCKQLKVKIKKGGSFESKLERMVKAVVEKELHSKSPQELVKSFKEIGVGKADKELIMKHLKSSGKVAVLPVLMQTLGPRVVPGIIEIIVASIIEKIIGRAAAKQLVKEFAKRNPWLNSMGPVIWALSGAWLVFDIQGPAFRKTIPVMLYLGVVALRDGEESINEKLLAEQESSITQLRSM